MTATVEQDWELSTSSPARDAFAGLYETHRGLVYSVIHARVGNAAIAEDLTSETFIRAWSKLHTFDGRNFAAWIRTIANNLTLDLVKSSRWRLDTAADITSEGPYDIPSAVGCPAEIVDRAWTTATIRQAVGRLPSYQRSVITDRYLNGLSIDETADRASVSTGAVKSNQHRAITRLGTELADIENRAAREAATRWRQQHTHAVLAGRAITATLTDRRRWPRHCTEHIEALRRRHYETLRATGRIASGLTDPDPVRARIRAHLDRGRTLHHLADTVGMEATALRKIHAGLTARVRVGTAARIMAVPLPPTLDDVLGWLRALARAGYSHRHIAAAAGIPRPTLRSALRRSVFHARLRVSIAAAYEQLAGQSHSAGAA